MVDLEFTYELKRVLSNSTYSTEEFEQIVFVLSDMLLNTKFYRITVIIYA